MKLKQPVARALLTRASADFDLPFRIDSRLILVDPKTVTPFRDEETVLFAAAPLCIEVYGVEPRASFLPIQAFVASVRIASRTSICIVGYSTPDGPITSQDETYAIWGHDAQRLTYDTIKFVQTHLPDIEPHLVTDSYSRFANALRLHNVALSARNSDLSLLGFVGAIESLFSVASQELSFRLSFILAKFLGYSLSEQRAYYQRAKKLYAVRSKISHGDMVASSEEGAAIQLAEHWVPEAEELSRLALREVLAHRLIDTFNSKRAHERFLDELLFAPSVADAMQVPRSDPEAG